MILCECQSAAHTTILLHARMSVFTHSMFNKVYCFNSNSLNFLLEIMNNRNGSTYIGTVHQHFQCFDISRWFGDRVSPVYSGERPGISTAHLFLWHDQILTSIGCGLSHDYLSGKLFVGVDVIKCVSWCADALCILCLRFDVHLSLAQGYCYNAIYI